MRHEGNTTVIATAPSRHSLVTHRSQRQGPLDPVLWLADARRDSVSHNAPPIGRKPLRFGPPPSNALPSIATFHPSELRHVARTKTSGISAVLPGTCTSSSTATMMLGS